MATFFIQDVYKISGTVVPVGRIESGILRIGMKANLDGNIVEIISIEKHHEQINEAQTGDSVGITVKVTNKNTPANSANQKISFFRRLFGPPINYKYSIVDDYIRQTIEFI